MAMGDKEDFPASSTPKSVDSMANKDKKLLSCCQTVTFTGEATESHELCCKDVRVVCSPGTHTSGSSNVKLRNIVDFNWDLKSYPGQLIAIHIKGNFFAYGLKAMGKSGESPGLVAGMVRVVSRSSDNRTLIRGLRGMVQDLAFSHLPQDVVLACVDQQGMLMVHHIKEKDSEITCTLLLHVERDDTPLVSGGEVHRVIWCPYIPDEGAVPTIDSEVGQLLALTRGNQAEMWCVPMVNKKYGPGPHQASKIEQGMLPVPPLDTVITDAVFSPDGTALALASMGGLVSFLQVYMTGHAAPRCLHSWRPHGDKPVSMISFLDNHQDYTHETQFWKGAVTGARDNAEIKLWTCDTWTCLQTIIFDPVPSPLSPGLTSSLPSSRCILKVALDLSSRYIVLSDLYNRMLYVLHLQQDKGPAHVSIVSGFTLPQPAMSFGIFEASQRKPNAHTLHERSDGEDDEGEGDFESLGLAEGESATSVVLGLFVVQPKSLQECRIAFKLDPKPPTLSSDTLVFCEDTTVATNGSLNDAELPISRALGTFTKLPVSESIASSAAAHNMNANLNTSGGTALNLMTPEAFSSPARNEDSPSRASNVSSSAGSAQRTTHTPPLPQAVPAPSELQQMIVSDSEEVAHSSSIRDAAMASGGSSPSREVQQILSDLSLKDNGDLIDEDFYDDKVEQLIDVQEVAAEIAKEPEEEGASYEWPQIPLPVPMEPQKPQATPAEQLIPPPLVTPVVVPVVEELRALNNCMENLTLVVEQQGNEIKQQRKEIVQQGNIIKDLEEVLAQRSSQMTSQSAELRSSVEQVITRHLQWHAQQSEKQISQKMAEMRDTLAAAFTKSVDGIVTARLGQAFNKEVQTQLVPALLGAIQPLQGIVHTELAQKLSTTDHLLQENLKRLANSKAVQDSIANTVAGMLQNTVTTCFRDIMVNRVVPEFEKSCKNLFLQLESTYTRGTREHLTVLEAQFEKQRLRNVERVKDNSAQLTSFTESVRQGHEATAAMVRSEVNAAVAQAVVGMQEAVCRSSREAVTESVNRMMREQSVRASRPETPQPTTPQAQLPALLALVAQGHYNAAFQQALSASDLSLLVKLCAKVNPQQLFSQTPCLLEQPVLLSLVQQLSADLNQDTQLKQKYLEEAITHLDPNSPIIKNHMPTVLRSVKTQFTAYIQANPNNPMTRSVRVLLMACQSLVQC